MTVTPGNQSPTPANDPFASGQKVISITWGHWGFAGTILTSAGTVSGHDTYFHANGLTYEKSSFRVASEDEINGLTDISEYDFRPGELYYYMGGSAEKDLADHEKGDIFEVIKLVAGTDCMVGMHNFFKAAPVKVSRRESRRVQYYTRAYFRPATFHEIADFIKKKEAEI